jgi:acyl-CoA thioester hydrolase
MLGNLLAEVAPVMTNPESVAHREPPPTRSQFAAYYGIGSRWMDNDSYGHVNNVTYYSYFDTAVNGYLMQMTNVDIRALPAIGLVVETSCRFLAPLSFPDWIDVGLALERVGHSSVTYRLGIFRSGEHSAAAVGRFVHVYVDAASRRPVEVPAVIRKALENLAVG